MHAQYSSFPLGSTLGSGSAYVQAHTPALGSPFDHFTFGDEGQSAEA